MVSVDALKDFAFQEIRKGEVTWVESCAHYVSTDGIHRESEVTYLTKWHGSPDIVLIFLFILFPNSAILSGIRYVLGPTSTFYPQLVRTAFPENVTNLFVPPAEGENNHFITCFSTKRDRSVLNELVDFFCKWSGVTIKSSVGAC